MTLWRRFVALGAGDRVLVVEGAVLLTAVKLGLALPFHAVRRFLSYYARPERRSARRTSTEPVDRVVWAVSAAARRLPFSTTCLVRALVADAMLRYRGHASEIRFGVRPPEAGSTALQAHAWIEHAGLVVLGEIGQSDYRVMTRTSISERP